MPGDHLPLLRLDQASQHLRQLPLPVLLVDLSLVLGRQKVRRPGIRFKRGHSRLLDQCQGDGGEEASPHAGICGVSSIARPELVAILLLGRAHNVDASRLALAERQW